MSVGVCAAGTVYLEFWKRTQAQIQFTWNVTNFEKEEVSNSCYVILDEF